MHLCARTVCTVCILSSMYVCTYKGVCILRAIHNINMDTVCTSRHDAPYASSYHSMRTTHVVWIQATSSYWVNNKHAWTYMNVLRSGFRSWFRHLACIFGVCRPPSDKQYLIPAATLLAIRRFQHEWFPRVCTTIVSKENPDATYAQSLITSRKAEGGIDNRYMELARRALIFARQALRSHNKLTS